MSLNCNGSSDVFAFTRRIENVGTTNQNFLDADPEAPLARDMSTAASAWWVCVASRPARVKPRERRKPPRRAPSSLPGPDLSAPPKTHASRRQVLAFLALVTSGSSRKAVAGCDATANPPPVVDIAATLEQARELYGTGRLDEATFVLVTAISFASGCDSLNSVPPRLDPASASSAVPLLKLLGDIYTDQFRWDDAIATYTLAIDSGGALNARGAFFGRANASEGKALQMSRLDEKNTTSADALYTQAVMDYTLCLGDTDTLNSTVTYATSLEKATITFERARALGALRRWADAKRDYETAAGLFLSGRDKKKSDIATAQAAFCAFEDGDLLGATHTLEALSLRLYSSDVRAALVAAYYKAGDFTKAESLWLDLCQLQGAQCGKYSNEKWLLEYRQWTPGVVRGMQDFLGMR